MHFGRLLHGLLPSFKFEHHARIHKRGVSLLQDVHCYPLLLNRSSEKYGLFNRFAHSAVPVISVWRLRGMVSFRSGVSCRIGLFGQIGLLGWIGVFGWICFLIICLTSCSIYVYCPLGNKSQFLLFDYIILITEIYSIDGNSKDPPLTAMIWNASDLISIT